MHHVYFEGVEEGRIKNIIEELIMLFNDDPSRSFQKKERVIELFGEGWKAYIHLDEEENVIGFTTHFEDSYDTSRYMQWFSNHFLKNDWKIYVTKGAVQ